MNPKYLFLFATLLLVSFSATSRGEISDAQLKELVKLQSQYDSLTNDLTILDSDIKKVINDLKETNTPAQKGSLNEQLKQLEGETNSKIEERVVLEGKLKELKKEIEDKQSGNSLFANTASSIFTFILSILSAVIAWRITSILGEKARKLDFGEIPVKPGERRNSIMVLGLGGSGKSEFCDAVCKLYKVDGNNETDEYHLRSVTEIVNDKGNSTTYHFHLSDYKGQSFGSQISAFIMQQQIPRTPMRYGHVNTMVFVVDIAPGKNKEHSLAGIDENRIQKHLDEWNSTALDAAFGMHRRDSLKLVVLYINKINALESYTPVEREAIRKSFKSLEDRIKDRCIYKPKGKEAYQYAEFHVFSGSLEVSFPRKLEDKFRSFSVPIMKIEQKDNDEPQLTEKQEALSNG